MITLAIIWSQVGLQIAYLLLSLSILVILHEFGHYITAKWFKCRVEKFFLFFDPWFSIAKKKIGETEYGIGWLPLGGYVKISGMVDESMDKEAMKLPPKPWEFRSKPAWQRLIIMLGGIIMNVLLAFFIYAMILYAWGEKKLPVANAKYGIWVTDSLMSQMGLKNGDKILAVNDEPVKYFNDLPAKILLGNKVTLDRNGQTVNLDLPVNFIEQLVEKKGKRSDLIIPRVPLIIGSYTEADSNSTAKKAGLQGMDKIVAIDGIQVQFFDEVIPMLQQKKNDSVTFSLVRNDQALDKKVLVNPEGKVGLSILNDDQYDSLGILKHETKTYTFFSSFPAGVKKTGEKLNFYIQQFKLILNPKTGAYKGLSGFKGMASVFPKSGWDWEAFWNITAFFSIVLAFMNLLPIPALDGGHVLFTLIEMITGKKPSDKFLEYAQIAGMIFLLGLMVFANANDWLGWGRGH
ncbi:RIP metalloprotease RseP [soil metagenome]